MKKNSNSKLLLAKEHLEEGNTLLKQQKFAASEKHLQIACELFKKHKEWKYYCESSNVRIQNYLHLLQFEKAKSESVFLLEITLQYFPDDARLLSNSHNNLGICAYESGNYQEALTHHEAALEVNQTYLEENHPDIARSWMFIGDCCMKKNEFKKALDYFQKALEVHLNHLITLQTAENYEKIGTCLTEISKYDKAIEHHQKAFEIKKNLIGEDNVSVAKSYESMGKTYAYLGKFKEAENNFEKAIALHQHHLGEKHPALANTYFELGTSYFLKKQLDLSLSFFEKAKNIFLQFYDEKHLTILRTTHMISACCVEKGDYEKALKHYQKSVHYFEDNENIDCVERAYFYNELGSFYRKKGDYEKALLYLNKAKVLFEDLFGKEHNSFAIVLNNIALAYMLKEDLSRARSYVHQSMKVRKKIFGENHPKIAKMYSALAVLADKDQDFQTGKTYNEKALAINRQFFGEEGRYVATNYQNLGISYAALQEDNKALVYYYKALAIQKKLFEPNHPQSGNVCAHIGHVYFKQKNYKKAIESYHTAIQILIDGWTTSDLYEKPNIEQYIKSDFLIVALTQKGLAFFHWYQKEGKKDIQKLHAALVHYQANHQLIKRIQQSYKGEVSKLVLTNNVKEKYDNAIEVALVLEEVEPSKKMHYQSLAFNFAEQSKALVLLSKFKDVEASSNSNIPSDLLQDLKQIRIELNYLDKQLKSENASKTDFQKELQNQYFDYKQQYYALIEKLEKEYPDYFRLKYATETVTITEFQKHLQFTTAIIEYSVAEHHIFSFFIDKQQVKTHQIAKPSNFDKTLLQHQRTINTGSASKFVKTSTQLYEWLIAPFEALIEDKQRLIFIPDENLHQLCFDTLVNQHAITKIAFSDLPYLIKDFEISHHYSATLLLHIAQKCQHTQKQTDSFFGLAPVTFNKNNTQPTGYIVKTEVDSPKKAKPVILKSGGNDEESLMDLEASEVEVKKVFNLFHQQNLESLALFYEKASKSNLQKLVNGYKYILISTHGFVNKSQPSLSGLYLSKPDLTKNTGFQEDTSKLYLSDAYQLSLTADLVVLSSCESGIGEVLKGEGIIALNRGFLYAGASNVIYSLFKVPQDSTSELVQALFHHILYGKCTYAQALRLAKLQLIEAGGELRDWAGFALLGV